MTVYGHREQGKKEGPRQFKDYVSVITLEGKENKKQDELIANASGRFLAIFSSFSKYVLAIFPHCLAPYARVL